MRTQLADSLLCHAIILFVGIVIHWNLLLRFIVHEAHCKLTDNGEPHRDESGRIECMLGREAG